MRFLCLFATSLEVISESHLDSNMRARWIPSSKHSESEFQVFFKKIPTSDLSLQLATAQLEVSGHRAKQFGAEL